MPPTMDPGILNRWIGRSETRCDQIRLPPLHLMEMTLDRDPVLAAGDPLPPLWHWLFFLQSARLGQLGRDGHPARGGFLPPVALPRRMWAGGRFGFTRQLPIGCVAEKRSAIQDVVIKQGRTGALCFVTLRHEISTDADLALWEEHDIVYRDDPGPGDIRPQPPLADTAWDRVETISPSEVMLLRYSDLTFTGHRLHYDRDYAANVEGHDGLVVHGPLIATLLADLAQRQSPGAAMRRFDFRAVSALYDTADFTIAARRDGMTTHLAAINAAGGLAMQASAGFDT